MGLIPWKDTPQQIGPREPSPLTRLRAEIDRLLDSFVREPMGGLDWAWGSLGAWAPAVDVAETNEEVTVRAEVPGIAPEDVQVSISGNHLVLAGEKKQSSQQQGESFFRTESRYGSFRRSIPLPEGVDPQQVTAEYAHGVLTVRIKRSAPGPVKRIDVKVKD